MKLAKIALLATTGAALVMSPAYAKPHQGHGDWRNSYVDSGWTPPGLAKKPYGMPPGQAKKMHRYARGQHLPRTYYVNRMYYVTNPRVYHLRAAPPGYQWVRVGNDVYLAQTRTGLVADIVAGLFH